MVSTKTFHCNLLLSLLCCCRYASSLPCDYEHFDFEYVQITSPCGSDVKDRFDPVHISNDADEYDQFLPFSGNVFERVPFRFPNSEEYNRMFQNSDEQYSDLSWTDGSQQPLVEPFQNVRPYFHTSIDVDKFAAPTETKGRHYFSSESSLDKHSEDTFNFQRETSRTSSVVVSKNVAQNLEDVFRQTKDFDTLFSTRVETVNVPEFERLDDFLEKAFDDFEATFEHIEDTQASITTTINKYFNDVKEPMEATEDVDSGYKDFNVESLPAKQVFKQQNKQLTRGNLGAVVEEPAHNLANSLPSVLDKTDDVSETLEERPQKTETSLGRNGDVELKPYTSSIETHSLNKSLNVTLVQPPVLFDLEKVSSDNFSATYEAENISKLVDRHTTNIESLESTEYTKKSIDNVRKDVSKTRKTTIDNVQPKESRDYPKTSIDDLQELVTKNQTTSNTKTHQVVPTPMLPQSENPTMSQDYSVEPTVASSEFIPVTTSNSEPADAMQNDMFSAIPCRQGFSLDHKGKCRLVIQPPNSWTKSSSKKSVIGINNSPRRRRHHSRVVRTTTQRSPSWRERRKMYPSFASNKH